MFIKNKSVGIGTRVILYFGYTIIVSSGTFIGPHEFTITSITERGWNLKDDQGREIFDVLLTQKQFEVIR